MKKKSLVVRIIAIVLCALMILGVVSAAISAFAYDGVPATGSNDNIIWFAVALGIATVVICVLAATKKKNK